MTTKVQSCRRQSAGAYASRIATWQPRSSHLAARVLLPSRAFADKSQPLDQRKAVYAPWSPDQMAQRRKDYGLIGPGTDKPFPPPAFPSYLKKPELDRATDAAGARRRAPDRRPHRRSAWSIPARPC